jgi:hypothetical protein
MQYATNEHVHWTHLLLGTWPWEYKAHLLPYVELTKNHILLKNKFCVFMGEDQYFYFFCILGGM